MQPEEPQILLAVPKPLRVQGVIWLQADPSMEEKALRLGMC